MKIAVCTVYKSTYQSWSDMKQRCLNPRLPCYHNYGGRGITICARWLESFQNFFDDMGEKPEGKTLERINNNGNYEPSNCKWATRAEQRRNCRDTRMITINGRTQTIKDWAKELGFSDDVLAYRIDANWPKSEWLSKPNFRRRKHT